MPEPNPHASGLDKPPRWGWRFWLVAFAVALLVIGTVLFLMRKTLLDIFMGRLIIGAIGFSL